MNDACDDYQLDMTASTFGTCKCGQPKNAHTSTGSRSFGRVAAFKVGQKKEKEEAKTGTSAGACGNYRLDVAAVKFGACKCGFMKMDHKKASPLARKPVETTSNKSSSPSATFDEHKAKKTPAEKDKSDSTTTTTEAATEKKDSSLSNQNDQKDESNSLDTADKAVDKTVDKDDTTAAKTADDPADDADVADAADVDADQNTDIRNANKVTGANDAQAVIKASTSTKADASKVDSTADNSETAPNTTPLAADIDETANDSKSNNSTESIEWVSGVKSDDNDDVNVVADKKKDADADGGDDNQHDDADAEGGACSDYRLDMSASTFGACKCGFPKAGHKSMKRGPVRRKKGDNALAAKFAGLQPMGVKAPLGVKKVIEPMKIEKKDKPKKIEKKDDTVEKQKGVKPNSDDVPESSTPPMPSSPKVSDELDKSNASTTATTPASKIEKLADRLRGIQFPMPDVVPPKSQTKKPHPPTSPIPGPNTSEAVDDIKKDHNITNDSSKSDDTKSESTASVKGPKPPKAPRPPSEDPPPGSQPSLSDSTPLSSSSSSSTSSKLSSEDTTGPLPKNMEKLKAFKPKSRKSMTSHLNALFGGKGGLPMMGRPPGLLKKKKPTAEANQKETGTPNTTDSSQAKKQPETMLRVGIKRNKRRGKPSIGGGFKFKSRARAPSGPPPSTVDITPAKETVTSLRIGVKRTKARGKPNVGGGFKARRKVKKPSASSSSSSSSSSASSTPAKSSTFQPKKLRPSKVEASRQAVITPSTSSKAESKEDEAKKVEEDDTKDTDTDKNKSENSNSKPQEERKKMRELRLEEKITPQQAEQLGQLKGEVVRLQELALERKLLTQRQVKRGNDIGTEDDSKAFNQATKFSLSYTIRSRPVLHAGWVEHLRGRISKSWKRYLWVLYRETLEVFETEHDDKPKEVMKLHDQVVVEGFKPRKGVDRPCCEIRNGTHTWRFQGEVVKDNKVWLAAFHCRILAAKYAKTCSDEKRTPDERVVAWLDSTQQLHQLDSGKYVAIAHPWPLSHRPLIDTDFSVVTTILADRYTQEVSELDLTDANLGAGSLRLLADSLRVSPTRVLTSLSLGSTCFPQVDHNSVNPLAPTEGYRQWQSGCKGLASLLTLPPGDENTELGRLVLRQCCIDDNVMENVQSEIMLRKENMSRLKHLDLSGNSLSCQGVATLVRLLTKDNVSALKAIEDGDNLSEGDKDKARQSIYTVAQSLVRLNLSNNTIGDAGASALATYIKYEPGLLDLDVSDNLVENRGAISIANALSSTNSLQRLNLSSNKNISFEGLHALAHMAQVNLSLERLAFGQHTLDLQGLTPLRLIHRYGIASTSPRK